LPARGEMRKPVQRLTPANRIALLRTGRVQADGRQNCMLKVLFEKRGGMREHVSSRMCLAAERVDALEVEIAALGEVEEQGIDERLGILAARARKSCKDVATQLNRERLGAGGGLANGAGKWQGNMDREQLMDHGYIVERGLLQALRGELGALLVAGRKAFNLTKGGRLRSSCTWRSNCAWAKVHVEHPRVGELGARSIVPEEALKAVPASARRSAQRGLEAVQAAVAAKAGQKAAAVADLSFLGSWTEMEPQAWHIDGEPRLAFIVALHDMAATEFLVPPKGVKWKDTLALSTAASRDAFRRKVFELVEADEQSVTGGASVAKVRMAAGDVCFFYTHWLHRAPAPPASVAEGARVCLFGVFGKKAASEGSPIFRHHVIGKSTSRKMRSRKVGGYVR
jgi:hypothetical protein